MKKLVYTVVAIVAICTTYAIYRPLDLAQGYSYIQHLQKGAKRHSLALDEETWVYSTQGSGETLILLHDFGGSKENWDSSLPYLAKRFTVIALDLPGFGESSKNADKNYTIASHAYRLQRFVKTLGLKHFHLAGQGMGATIAGEYAAKHPQRIHSLWLISPAGVESAEPSAFVPHFEETGDNIYATPNAETYARMVSWLYHTPPSVPPVFKHLRQLQAAQEQNFLDTALEDLLSDWAPLENALENLDLPVLITWGTEDRMNHVSGAQALADILPNVRQHLLPNCGSRAMEEYPQATTERFIRFVAQQAQAQTAAP